MVNSNTFIKITNQDIYAKIEELIDHVKTTNGRVKLNTWRSAISLSLVISLIFILIGALLKFNGVF